MKKNVVLATLVCFLCLGAIAAAEPAPKVLTTDALWKWVIVGDPQLSPDGKRVVFVRSWNDAVNDARYANLWVASVETGEQRPVTQGNFRDTSPRWSPDGSRIAYLSDRSGKSQINVRWMDTGQEAKITDLENSPSNISWSPDGKSIAFTARVKAKPAWSVKTPERPAGAKWADPPIVITRLRWRQDGAGLVTPGNMHVFVAPSVGGAARQVTAGEFDYPGRPAWTADGQSLLVSCVCQPDAEYSLEGPDIYAIQVKDGSAKQLTNRKGPDMNPVVSPDGKRIAYTGFDYRQQSYNVTRLYVMDIDGANVRLVSGAHDRDVRDPQWSADSRTLYFLSDDRGSSQLFRGGLAEGTVRAVTTGKHRLGSAYAMSDPFSMAGLRVATTRSTPSEPPDVVTFTVDRPDRITRLTAANDSLLADLKLGDVEEVSWDSFDGKPIQGWLVKPPDFDPGRKYPMILSIHGGPHAMYGVEFNQEFQVFAARGFVVLYPNPRGSTGYGEDFGNIIHGNYPGDDFKDLMTGVDTVLKRGYIDPKRLAVTGGSGGGLLTAWTIGQTDRFAAAVSQYPVANWITQVGTADGGYYHAALWMKGMPWDNTELYLKKSPVFYAAKFKTPTMVITGENDLRTPIAQSEELYFALKARKVDAVLIRIPDEPHGIRGRHPSHWLAKVEHVLGWIEKYTKKQ